MDQTQVDQHLASGSHGQLRKDAAHQSIPINNGVCVVSLGTVGRRGETQRSLFRLHQSGDHRRVTGIATDQTVRTKQPDITSSRYRVDRRVRNFVTCVWGIVGIIIASLIVTGLTALYTVFLAAGGGAVLAFLFGDKFRHFTNLIVPTAVGQLMAAAGIGFIVLLKASKRGRPLVMAHIISTVGTLIVTPILAIRYGVVGAAWGLAIGYGLESLALILLSWRLPKTGSDHEGHLAEAELTPEETASGI